MSLTSNARKCLLPLIAAASLSVMWASPALADPPRVSVNGAGNGQLQLNNPLSFKGVAQDPQGIEEVYAFIQTAATGKYVTQKGRMSDKAERIQIKYNKATTANWVTQSFNLPRGRYILSVRAIDSNKAISPNIQVPFVATGAKGANIAAVPATNQRAPAAAAGSAVPRIAIQFPQNGARLDKAQAFSGIAKDDQGVVRVIATIMDSSTGMFLTPKGGFAQSGQLQLRTIQGKNAQWSTPQVQLPPGDYVLSVKAVDTEGQEGQWAQSKFSIAPQANQPAARVAAAPTAATAVAAGAKAANGMAYCANQGLDADGDGFGWQNNASCVVSGSKADTHPTCASSASDPDGDGYGWENEKSCIVVVHCGSASSDADGDGFGWENGRSCIVLDQASSSNFRACAQGAASDPDGDGYGWENNATCLVR